MIFGYTIPEAKKAVAGFIVFALSVIAYWIAFDPSLTTAIPVLGSAIVGVIGIFMSKNHSPDDVQKALAALFAAIIGVASVFLSVDQISTLQTAVTCLVPPLSYYVVKWTSNAPAPSPAPKAVHRR